MAENVETTNLIAPEKKKRGRPKGSTKKSRPGVHTSIVFDQEQLLWLKTMAKRENRTLKEELFSVINVVKALYEDKFGKTRLAGSKNRRSVDKLLPKI